MEGAIHMMTFWERIYKATGSSEADRMCLVEGTHGSSEPMVSVRYWKIVRFNRVQMQGMFQKALLVPASLRVVRYIRLGMGEEGSGVVGLASSRASQAIL
eukprot:1160712-Pelagomonas_calceolata.AAC.3